MAKQNKYHTKKYIFPEVKTNIKTNIKVAVIAACYNYKFETNNLKVH